MRRCQTPGEHGNSSTPLHGNRHEDQAGDIIELIQGLVLSDPISLGHSMGGMTAAVVASLAAKNIRGVILVDLIFLSPQRQRGVCDSDVAEQRRRLLGQDKCDVLAQLRSRRTRRFPEIAELIDSARLQIRMRPHQRFRYNRTFFGKETFNDAVHRSAVNVPAKHNATARASGATAGWVQVSRPEPFSLAQTFVSHEGLLRRSLRRTVRVRTSRLLTCRLRPQK